MKVFFLFLGTRATNPPACATPFIKGVIDTAPLIKGEGTTLVVVGEGFVNKKIKKISEANIHISNSFAKLIHLTFPF